MYQEIQTGPLSNALYTRQLHHRTKKVLQWLVGQAEARELRTAAAGAALADEVQRRITLSAQISEALFDRSLASGSMEERLEWLTEATVALLSDCVQTIRTEVAFEGQCPRPLIPVVLQVAHEMVSNAVKHGMRMRLIGRIFVSLRTSKDGSISLKVCDDGWGPGAGRTGEGHSIMSELAGGFGGSVSLTRNAGWTVATMSIPSLPLRKKEYGFSRTQRTR
ncbi:MAG: sensor histidine kinase [Acetobacteraceae bacterium]|nr:sensor histidine kinase [Acetobacteraceae bacterium]MBV8522470.1 sensor histidine kinase [Acetobacteraceae bacterium]